MVEDCETAAQRANTEYKKLLNAYQPPELDPGIEDALQAFMARRKAEIKPEY
jgi:trimethylamine--corrinoid protein Co-methyltransferase